VTAPDCYQCQNRRNLPSKPRSQCVALLSRVTARRYGQPPVAFFWPINFDPADLGSCDGFRQRATTTTTTTSAADSRAAVGAGQR
jgi:hypothetical protein